MKMSYVDDVCYLVRRLDFVRLLVLHIDGSGSESENELLNVLDEQMKLLLKKAKNIEKGCMLERDHCSDLAEPPARSAKKLTARVSK